MNFQEIRIVIQSFSASFSGFITVFAAALVGLLMAMLLFEALKILLNKSIKSSSSLVNQKLRTIFYTFFTVVMINLVLPVVQPEGIVAVYLSKCFHILFIVTFSLLVGKGLQFAKALLFERYDISAENNLSGRKIRTQIDFIYKLSLVLIGFVAIAVILMSFKSVRELGTSLLASAGIAGIIVGLAAQKSIGNLLAGFQIAFTQPIRIDDVVIVENEWGRIQEITLTYVVVRIWDQRNLIVPISYFLDNPFQNWTRDSAEILGTVFLYVDYSLPVDAIRAEVTRLLGTIALWDGRVNVVQVTDATEKSMQIRILVSARNSGDAFALRTIIREKVIAFIQQNYPESLPKFRAEKLDALSGKMTGI